MPPHPAPSTLPAERIRRILLLACILLALLVVAAGCGGGDDGDDGDPPPPPSGEMRITGISSLNPWLGDTITVTGTGFGGAPADYLVRFPECEPAGCTIYSTKVLSVTPTQITMWLVHSGLSVGITRGRMRIYKHPGTSDLVSTTADDFMDFRIPPWAQLEENYDYHFDPPVVRGGDSLSFLVIGYDPGGINSLRVEAWELEISGPTVLNEDTGLRRVFTSSPPRQYGTGPVTSPDAQQMVPMTFTVNGRTASMLVRAFRVPTYQVTGFSPSTIDLSAGTQLTISGVNMPGQILVRWIQGATELISTANGCADACNSVTAPPPAGITPGTYDIVVHLSLFTDLTLVGLGTVSVVE